jgi:hypothetical protein
MNQKQTFRAVIENAGDGGAYVKIPFDVEQVFGKKRVKVKAWIEGQEYRGSLVRMGAPCHILGILKEIREKTGKTFGDEIEVSVEEDTEPRIIPVPADLRLALHNQPEAEAFFQALAYTHQKEYVQWIEQAKREQTRQERVAQAVRLLQEKKKERGT